MGFAVCCVPHACADLGPSHCGLTDSFRCSCSPPRLLPPHDWRARALDSRLAPRLPCTRDDPPALALALLLCVPSGPRTLPWHPAPPPRLQTWHNRMHTQTPAATGTTMRPQRRMTAVRSARTMMQCSAMQTWSMRVDTWWETQQRCWTTSLRRPFLSPAGANRDSRTSTI